MLNIISLRRSWHIHRYCIIAKWSEPGYSFQCRKFQLLYMTALLGTAHTIMFYMIIKTHEILNCCARSLNMRCALSNMYVPDCGHSIPASERCAGGSDQEWGSGGRGRRDGEGRRERPWWPLRMRNGQPLGRSELSGAEGWSKGEVRETVEAGSLLYAIHIKKALRVNYWVTVLHSLAPTISSSRPDYSSSLPISLLLFRSHLL